MNEVKLYKSPVQGLKMCALCLPFIAAGMYFLLTKPVTSEEFIISLVGVCFFGFGIATFLFQAFDRRPQIIIRTTGLWDRSIKEDEIAWEHIVECYPIDVHGQKFISLVTDSSFVPKKKVSRLAARLNKMLGAQNLNINLSQIDINEQDLSEFLNDMINTPVEKRKTLLASLRFEKPSRKLFIIRTIAVYCTIAIVLLCISLVHLNAFIGITIICGIGAIIARLQVNNGRVKKYAMLATYSGLINMVLCLGASNAYELVVEKTLKELVATIEQSYHTHKTFPDELSPIIEQAKLNIFEKYTIKDIQYTHNDNFYTLELKIPLNKTKQIKVALAHKDD